MYQCDLCDKTLEKEKSLQRHRAVYFRMHEVDKTKSYLYQRDQEIKDLKKYECDICGMKFTKLHGMRQHRSIHIKHYQCEIILSS